MAIEIFSLIECCVKYENGRTEIRRVGLHEITATLPRDGYVSAVDYLKNGLNGVKSVTVLDTYHFTNEDEYLKFLKTTY